MAIHRYRMTTVGPVMFASPQVLLFCGKSARESRIQFDTTRDQHVSAGKVAVAPTENSVMHVTCRECIDRMQHEAFMRRIDR